MSFYFIILIICLVLFLFRLYHVANDDLILVKKNISLEEVYNCAFVSAFSALFFSRIFYVIMHPQPVFFSILGFLVFPYFPGLSLLGGIIGGGIVTFLYCRWKKFPIGRVFDFFTVALTFIIPVGILGYMFLSQNFSKDLLISLTLFIIIGLAANMYLHPKASSLQIKDGSISILFMIFYSLVMLLINAISHPGINNFLFYKVNFILLFMLVLGIVLIFKQEAMIGIKFKPGKHSQQLKP
jgi:prolipoprotein diacylglyceryltransferase